MSDLEWIFNVDGNAAKAIEQVDQVLASLPKDLGKAEAGLKGLERALAAQNIAKINDPLRQNIALAKLHAQVLRDEAAAVEKVAASEKHQAAETAKATAATLKAADAAKKSAAGDAAKETDAVGSALANAFGVGNLAKITSVAGGIELVAGAVKGLASFVANGSLELFKFAFEASQGKRAMLGMLQVFEGGRTDSSFAALQDMGIAAGQSADKTVSAFAQLRSAGFKAKEAQDIIAASFDISAARGGGAGGAAAADKFQDLFTKFRALGKVGSKDMLALARDVGVDPSKQLPEALAARMKIPVANALKLLEAGKADAGAVQNALLDIVQKDINKGGGLGTKAKGLADGDALLQLQRAKDIVSNLFEDASFKPVADTVKKIADGIQAADKDGRLKAIAERMVGLLGGVENVDIAGGIEAVVEVVDEIVTGLEEAKAAFGDAFHPEVYTQVIEQFDKIDKILGKTGGHAPVMKILGWVFGTIATNVAMAAAVLVKFVEFEERAVASTGKMLAAVKAAGGAVVDGFTGGMTGGGKEAAIADASQKMAQVPVKAVESELEIRSPSRKMHRLAGYTWEGWEQGHEAYAPDAMAPINDRIATPVIAASSGAAAGGPSRASVVLHFGDIIVKSGSAGSVREEVRSAVYEALEEAGLT